MPIPTSTLSPSPPCLTKHWASQITNSSKRSILTFCTFWNVYQPNESVYWDKSWTCCEIFNIWQLLLTDTATLLHQLQPERSAHQRAGCESWSCTWSGDGSLFAWSCGNHIVKLIPWNRCRHCMYVKCWVEYMPAFSHALHVFLGSLCLWSKSVVIANYFWYEFVLSSWQTVSVSYSILKNINFCYKCVAIVLFLPSVLCHCWLGSKEGIRHVKDWIFVCCCWWHWFDWS